MTNVCLSRYEMFNLLELKDFKINADIITDTLTMIERNGNLKLSKTVSNELRTCLRSKYVSLRNAWNRLKTVQDRDVMRMSMKTQTCLINILHMDMDEGIASYKDRIDYLERQNNELNNNLNTLISRKKAYLLSTEKMETDDMSDCPKQAIVKIESKVFDDTAVNRDSVKWHQIRIEQLEKQNKQLSSSVKILNNELKAYLIEHFDQSSRSQTLANDQQDKKHPLKGKHNIKRLQPQLLQLPLVHEKRKNFFNVCQRQKNRLIKNLKDMLSKSTEFLHTMGLCMNSVVLYPLELKSGEMEVVVKSDDKDADDHVPNVNRMLFYKDKFSISDKAYAALKTKCKLNIPSLHKIRQKQETISEHYTILRNELGVYLSFKSKLTERVTSYFERTYGSEYLADDTAHDTNPIVHVKLAADGTNIGRNLKLLNFTFTILNEGLRSRTASGNYTIGIFEIENENYDSVKTCFRQIIEELRDLNDLQLGKRLVHIVYYFAGDYKMLLNSLGLLNANSKYPCVWCMCCKDEFADSTREWSIHDANKGAREFRNIQDLICQTNKKAIKYGHDREPIFQDIIPISRYMIDMLHLFLRISDTLINLLVKDCTLVDKFEAWNTTSFNISDYKSLYAFQTFLNKTCRVSFRFVWIAETKKLTWRDLVGPEKIRLFENFDIKQIVPEHDKLESVTRLWSDFYTIQNDVKNLKINATQVKEQTRSWFALFLSVYNKTAVTPYIHAFVCHLHEFIELYSDINAFNLQGLEKLNEMTTGQYFKSTNKHNDALEQILKKRNRMEYLKLFVADTDLND